MHRPRSFQKIIIATAAMLVALQMAGPAAAASDGRGWVDSIGDMISSVGASVASPFRGAGVDMATEPTAMRQFSDGGGGDRDPFWHHLEEAGYQLKEIKTEISLIPNFDIEFVLARELSEADRSSLERQLEIDKKRRPGMLGAIKRRIVRTLIEASDYKDLYVENLTISLLPLPAATFVLAPIEGPLAEEHDVLFRMLQNIERATEKLGSAKGGRGFGVGF